MSPGMRQLRRPIRRAEELQGPRLSLSRSIRFDRWEKDGFPNANGRLKAQTIWKTLHPD